MSATSRAPPPAAPSSCSAQVRTSCSAPVRGTTAWTAVPTRPCGSTPSPAPPATRPSRRPTSRRGRPPAPPPARNNTSPAARRAPTRWVARGLHPAGLAGAVEQLRVIKDEEEISCLRIGAEIADQALGELLESILVGRTERHLALELERRLVDHGADGPAFATSVGTGPNAGRPGHRPTDRRVEEGDFLSVCLGASYRGYRCEIGRTFVIGTSPADWQIELYDLVFAAQRAARETLAPGAAYRDVDRAARQVLESAGQHEGLPTLTGHGVGLEIDADAQLPPGPRVGLGRERCRRLAPAGVGKVDA